MLLSNFNTLLCNVPCQGLLLTNLKKGVVSPMYAHINCVIFIFVVSADNIWVFIGFMAGPALNCLLCSEYGFG